MLKIKSLRFRLTGILFLTMLILCAVIIFIVIQMYNLLIDGYGQRGAGIARSVAAMLDGDTVDHYLDTLEKDDDYEQLLRQLRILQRENGITSIRILQVVDGGAVYVFNTDEASPFGLGALDRWDESNDALVEQLRRGERIAPFRHETRQSRRDTQWDMLIKTYEPIYREDGSVAAYVDVGISIDDVRREQNNVFISIGALGPAVIILFSLLNIRILRKNVIYPISTLVNKVSAYMPIGQQHKTSISVKFNIKSLFVDEVEVLDIAVSEMESRIDTVMVELREAEEHTKLMLDTTPLCCQLWDSNLNLIDCNVSAVKLYGFSSKQEYIDRFFSLSPEYQPDGRRSDETAVYYIKKAVSDGRVSFDWTHQMLDGTPMPAKITLVRVAYGDDYLVAGYTLDLREIKAAEMEILESRERERSLEIQKEAAQAANEAKSQFLANMSHEIRTPMNGVLGMAELLLSESLSERQYTYAEDIKTSALSLLDIVNDILDISKIQSGKLSLAPAHYYFSELIDNVGSMARFLAEKKNLVFELNVQDDMPKCLYGDDVRLRQILLNLLSNAIKFTDKGYVRVTVSGLTESIEIDVKDSGIGISPENLSTIFDDFEQADMQKNRYRTGTGLGLSITKSLVDMMDGQLTVESEYGQGTVFHLVIPKIMGDEQQIQHSTEFVGRIHAPDAQILVVDDNETNLKVVNGFLKLCGITAKNAMSGREAVEMVRQNQYDIVFMDHMMPEMDGVEATKIIREMGIGTPIIALTANAIAGNKEMFIQSGMDDMLSKPLKKALLHQQLEKWLPAEKLLTPPEETADIEKPPSDADMELREKVQRIKEVSVERGLDSFSGRWGDYLESIKLTIRQMEKCDKRLTEFLAAADMRGFCIEVHGMKGSLANIGIMELSEQAHELEIASGKPDVDFCSLHLPPFLEELNRLCFELKDVFGKNNQSDAAIEIPAELPQIFERMIAAFDIMNLAAIESEIENIEAMELSGTLKDEIELINEAVMMMDYTSAVEVMQRILTHKA